METITRWVQAYWFYVLGRFIAKVYFKLFHDLKVYDADKVPQGDGGAVIASNHISAADPPVMGVSVPREVNYMAKKELFENRFFRALILGLRAYPVDRSKNDLSAVKESLKRLKGGRAIGIFAQGTRNQGEQPALQGAAFIAQRAGVPLVPAAVWKEGRKFRVKFGDPIIPEGKTREEANAMTAELMTRINDLIPAHIQRPGQENAVLE